MRLESWRGIARIAWSALFREVDAAVPASSSSEHPESDESGDEPGCP